MSGSEPVVVPNLVRDALERDGAYDFGLGVVLRAPTAPGGDGGSASYRIDYRLGPALPDQPLARRRQRYARRLEEACAKADAIFAEMKQRASGTYVEYATDVSFGQVVQRWYDSPHPRWGHNYPAKVRTLLSAGCSTRVSRSPACHGAGRYRSPTCRSGG